MKINSKKLIKVLAVILVIVAIFAVVQPVMAAEIVPGNIKGNDGTVDTSGIQTIANKVATIIRNIAIVTGVIMLMVIGVKYMMGSAEEKADYKKSLMPLVIGIVVVMSASVAVTFVMSLFKNS